MSGSLYRDLISVMGMGRRRVFVAQAAKGSGSVPAIAMMAVCSLSPWMKIVERAGWAA
jgi:hypothetical protein